MKARLGAAAVVATLALVNAPAALADNPPTPLAPSDGASFVSTVKPITFQASSAASPAVMDFYVARDQAVDSNGVLASPIDHLTAVADSGGPGVYEAAPGAGAAWPGKPGTYYWQAVYDDCTQSTDPPPCRNEGPIQSFDVVENPPTPVSPDAGASLTARADQLVFQASTTTVPEPGRMEFYVASSDATGSDGVLSNWIEHLRGDPTSSDPTLYRATPDPDSNWPNKPGTYYWQPVYNDCAHGADPAPCPVEGPIRDFTLDPLPPPAPLSPNNGATIPFGGQMTFSLQDVPSYRKDGTSLYIEFATRPGLDPDGTFAHPYLLARPTAAGGGTYRYTFTRPFTHRAGTYYWIAERADDLAESDGIVTDGQVRSFSVAAPKPPPPGQRPNTFFTRHPHRRTHKHKVTFAFTSNAKDATFQCFYTGGWSRCHSPQTFRHLKPGRYRFKVRAVSKGRRDATPAKWLFKVRRRHH